jgi:aldehyde:ferredoxin oxidoreductase
MYDCLGACVFGVVARSILPLNKLIDLVQGVTGWDTSLWEMLKVGERTANLMRMFNVREGFSRKDDKLPGLFFENIKGGPLDGKNAMDREAFRLAIREYYQMVGWDTNGKPLKGKLDELGISKDFKEFFKG